MKPARAGTRSRRCGRGRLSPRPAGQPEPAISEAQLEAGWLSLAQSFANLIDSHGRRVEVIYPGRRSPGPGPDVEDAILSFDGGPAVHGDVEVHLDSLDWFRHGHHQDPAYSGVLLQVAWAAPNPGYAGPPTLSFGAHVANVKPLGMRFSTPPEWPCVGSFAGAGAERAARLLAWQGWERLVEKSEVLESDLAVMSPDEAFYRGVLDALGYSQNRDPFRRLGELLSWTSLSRIIAGAYGDPLVAEALLFGSAGLLPSQRWGSAARELQESRVDLLEHKWTGLHLPSLAPGFWRFYGVRPMNWPTRRLAAAARLFGAILPNPPVEALLLAVVRAAEARQPQRLQRLFTVPVEPENYWARRIDFGRGLSPAASSLLGEGRARDILINVALPLAVCVTRSRGDAALLGALRELFLALGGVAENRITSYMSSLTGTASLQGVRAAARQQGFLHIYRHWCRAKVCSACPAATAGAQSATDLH